MVDVIVEGGVVATMDERRRVIEDGAVAISGSEVVAVDERASVRKAYDADRVVDARGGLVLPGLINTHVHVPDILYRGRGKGRRLHDWLCNVKWPFVAAMDRADHELAAELYCRESLRSGTTTFVENAGGLGNGYDDPVVERKLDVYDRAGIRNVYAHGFLDGAADPALDAFLDIQRRKEPDVVHVTEPPADTEAALERVESVIEQYHNPGGRQTVWPGPFLAWGVTPAGLAGAYDLAERHDVMTTTHTAESPVQERNLATSVEYLESAGYLGERTLLGHCVQVTEADVRRLAATDTRVAHNVATNCSLATGVAPVPEMRTAGVTVGLGTDNVAHNDTANLVSDMRVAALVHAVDGRDPTRMTAEAVLEMATVDAARAIGREDELGSIESGKRADLVVLDCDAPHLTPRGDVPSLVVYRATGAEISTVLCDGEVVVDDGECTRLGARPEDNAVVDRVDRLLGASGLDGLSA